jgi:lyso-ornithine lipid O-acyltransferase
MDRYPDHRRPDWIDIRIARWRFHLAYCWSVGEIEPYDKLAVAEQIANLRDAIAENRAVTIFPEGTTTDGRSLLPFKPSLFATVVPPPKKLLIQPVLLDFDEGGKELAWLGEETAPENAWRVFTRKGTFTVRVDFLQPFDPGDHPDRKLLTTEARRRIAAALSKTLGYEIPA